MPKTTTKTKSKSASANTESRQLSGRILFDHGLPAAAVIVRLYSLGFGGADALLGEAETDDHGQYTISYDLGEHAPNLDVRAVSANDDEAEVSLADTLYNAGPTEVMNLVAPSSIQPLASEYDRLTADLKAQIGKGKLAAASENGDRRDLTMLHKTTNWDARLIALLATASKLSEAPLFKKNGITQEVLYGLLRAGLPADKQSFAAIDSQIIKSALDKAKAAGIIDIGAKQVGAMTSKFRKKAKSRAPKSSKRPSRKARSSSPVQGFERAVKSFMPRGEEKMEKPVRKFLSNAAELNFELGRVPVGSFITHNDGSRLFKGVKREEIEATIHNVKRLHRLYQITPDDNAMSTLNQLGFDSAHSITALSSEEFVERFGDQFDANDEAAARETARLVHRKAQQVTSVAYNVLALAKQMDSAPAIYAMSPPAGAREAAKAELIKQYPTLESLFGSLDYCECEHCRSVLSPAAYFVDLLQFLNPNTPASTGKKPYDALVERRPDLPNLPLTCENTNTTLPYIDVVNEILEYYVAKGRLEEGAARDTGDATTPELLAEPQYIEPAAYDKLNGAIYPLALPFDLWLETVRQFLDHFEKPLGQVLEVLRKTDALFALRKDDPDYYSAAIFAEQLGISPSEYSIFTEPPSSENWRKLYGYNTEPESVALNELEFAVTLSRKLGVSYKELIEVIDTGFINLVLTGPDTGCNFDETKLGYTSDKKIDAIALLKINLFVRMRKKLGWTVEELDRTLEVFLPEESSPLTLANIGEAMKTVLIYLAHLKTLDEKLKLGKDSRLKLLTLWSNLATTGRRPLYAQLFLTRSMLKSDSVFESSQGQFLPEAQPPILIERHLLALQGALGLTADEIGRILKDAGQSIATAELSLKNVSLLYRYGLLAKGLRLSVRDLITLKTLSGLDPFKPLSKSPLSKFKTDEQIKEDRPFSQTLRFVETVEKVKESGFQIEDLDYLLRHMFDPTGKYRTNTDDLSSLVKSIVSGLKRIEAEHAVPADQSAITDDFLREKLGLILTANVLNKFMGFWKDTIEFSEVKEGVSVEKKLNPSIYEVKGLRVSYDVTRGVQRLTHAGVLTDEKKADILSKVPAPVDANFKELLDKIAGSSQPQPLAFVKQYFEGFLTGSDGIFGKADIAVRRTKLLTALLPFIRERLSRRLVLDLLTARFGGDSGLTESLLTDRGLLADPSQSEPPNKPLLDVFMLDTFRTAGVTANFFTSTDLSGTPAVKAVANPSTIDAGGPTGTKSARFEGYLEVPTAGAYRFIASMTRKDIDVEFRIGDLPGPLLKAKASADDSEISQFIELKAGVQYRYALDARDISGGHVSLAIQSENLTKGSLDRLTLYQADTFDRVGRALVLLGKILDLIRGFKLSEREVRYIISHSHDFDDLKLSGLPTRVPVDSSASSVLFGQFLRLADYARLKREMGIVADDLIEVFEIAQRGYDGMKDPVEARAKDLCQRIAEITRRDVDTVREMAIRLGFTFGKGELAQERDLLRLWRGLQVVERLGVSVAAVVDATNIISPAVQPSQRFTIARDLRNAVKARYESERWLHVAQPIFDKLRQKRRDALAAYIMDLESFDRIEQLFEYFLIDAGMEPVVETSRLRLAISSVQLFVQRCLLNLEPKVRPSAINSGQWQWMKRYRVWEANRKIFLYPENFLEPEFRDDKTHLFQEMESALLQGDVSNDLAEDAFYNYLKKLEEIARLEIVTTYLEEKSDPASNVLHVLGRTYGQPHKYFYRSYAHRMWTVWDPVNIQIEGDHIALVVWRDRLHLFWVTLLEKTEPPKPKDPADDPTMSVMGNTKKVSELMPIRLVDLQLNWSDYYQGQWSPGQASGFIGSLSWKNFDSRYVAIGIYEDQVSDESVALRIVAADRRFPNIQNISYSFRVASRNGRPEFQEDKSLLMALIGAYETSVTFTHVVSFQKGEYRSSSHGPTSEKILKKGNLFSAVHCVNRNLAPPNDSFRTQKELEAWYCLTGEPRKLTAPFFWQNKEHTFYVEPTMTETITTRIGEEVFAPIASPAIQQGLEGRLDSLAIEAQVPASASDSSGDLHALARFKPRPRLDWVTESENSVEYDQQLIGRDGMLDGQSEPTTTALSVGR